MDREQQDHYLLPLKSEEKRLAILKQRVLDQLRPELSYKGKDLELEALKSCFMREGIEYLFREVDALDIED